MNSKEALERLYSDIINLNEIEEDLKNIRNDYIIVKQDLDRLEKLQKENKELRKSIKSWNENAGNLLKENIKLKKAIEILKNIFGIASVYSDKYDNHIERVLDCYDTFYIIPTQEQYELLTEVLSNER